jgi:anaerobic selenocysteine-containing dehydrogenase
MPIDMHKEEAIQKFRRLINEFKRKCLESTEKQSDHMQDIDKTILPILHKLDTAYDRIQAALSSRTTPSESQPFEYSLYTKGGLDYLQAHPESQGEFEYYLKLDMKQYPFTTNPGHIDDYTSSATPSGPVIISNNE